MVIGIVGISGVGKSYLKKQALTHIKGLLSLFAATTRPQRNIEINRVDKYFVSEVEFSKMQERNEMFLVQDIYGYKYGFLKKDIERNTVFITEMLLSDIVEMNQYSKVKTIYIFSNNNKAIYKNLQSRYADNILLQERIAKDLSRRNELEAVLLSGMFDHSFENHFDEKSTEDFVLRIKQIIGSD
jgi:guanylate kinase